MAQKKVSVVGLKERRMFVEYGQTDLSVNRQCNLLSLHRSGVYYVTRGECALNLRLMDRLDELYTEMPFYGSRKFCEQLRREGFEVNRKRIRRLMRVLGLEAIYPHPRLSCRNPEHRVFPYLLRGLAIEAPNVVWSTDITYIRLTQGFAYLVAIIDWYSRYVIAWTLSNTLDVPFCLEALETAFRCQKPKILNSDQGCQFTSTAFTQRVLAEGVQMSMDGRGRALDNIFIERLWRSVKYELIFINEYTSLSEVRRALSLYFDFYNTKRLHQALNYQTPQQVHFGVTNHLGSPNLTLN